MNARTLAATLLHRWSHSRQLADELLDAALAESSLSGPDRALTQELFYGCLRHKLALEFLVTQIAVKPPRPAVAELLQLGLYQLLFLDKIPVHAAVHETVELAKHHASPAEVRFVNAALRQVSRQQAGYLAKLRELQTTQPWVTGSHPRWLWERWQTRWGAAATAALCEWNNTPPPVYVRLNTLVGADCIRDNPESRLQITPTEHPLVFRTNNPTGLIGSAAWARGEFYVQDPSTLIAVDVLDPQPGESVLDLCAAPGGKTTYIAQKMQNRGQIIAADSSASRLALVGENCRRLGVTIVATLPCEGTRLNRCLRGRLFDRVLVDAPCSNTGVLRRRVDLRWRIAAAEITRLAALQLKLLAAAAQFTKPGGVLVYSTCSLEPEENDQVAARFAEAHPAFVREDRRETFPPRDGVDGAFVTRWRKNEGRP